MTEKGVEKKKNRTALKECGYPKWAIDRVKRQITDRPQKPTMTKKDNSNKSRGMVGIPYVEGVSEKTKRIYSNHNILYGHETYQHTQKHLSPPKGQKKKKIEKKKKKKEITDSSDVVNDAPCRRGGCEKSYIAYRWNRETIWDTPQRTTKGRWKTNVDIKFTRAARPINGKTI